MFSALEAQRKMQCPLYPGEGFEPSGSAAHSVGHRLYFAASAALYLRHGAAPAGGILWENEKVQVILLLNVPKSQYNMWEVVFKRLYQYLIGDQGVTKLIKDKDYDDFIRHLERNE